MIASILFGCLGWMCGPHGPLDVEEFVDNDGSPRMGTYYGGMVFWKSHKKSHQKF